MRTIAWKNLSRALVVLGFAAPAARAAEEPPTALPETVITATRGVTPAEQVGSTVTVITAEEIERSQKSSVAEILRSVPGLDVVRSGGPGQSVSVFSRGTESNHTLVLIDGIEATDPSVPGNTFDFSSLQVDDIERIEIVRGPQSTLYGSDAIGGVIQILTRRGFGARNGAQLQAGRYGSYAARGSLHGGDPYVNYGLSFHAQTTDGVSAFPEGGEEDGYENKTLAGYVFTKPTDESSVDFTLRRIEFDADLDNFNAAPPFQFADDGDTRVHTEQWLARLQGGYSLLDGRWMQRLGLSLTDHERTNRNGPEPINVFSSKSRFEGKKTKLDWVQDFRLNQQHQLSLGLETEDEEAELTGGQSPETGNDAVFFQDHVRINDVFFTTVGLRRDKHDDFGSETTWRLAPVFLLPDSGTRLRASYGTGFKAPSLSDLFESFPPFFFANPDLKPERSKGWDIGVEQKLLGDALQLELTYFRNDIEDLIAIDPVTFSTLVNIGEASTKGYELGARYQLLPQLALGASYTHTRAVDEATGDDLIRRPRKKARVYADWRILQELTFGFAGRYVGERDDVDANFIRVEAPSHTVFDASLAYAILPQWTLLGRVDNAFDKDYEEIPGFGNTGRALHVGVRYTAR